MWTTYESYQGNKEKDTTKEGTGSKEKEIQTQN